MVSPYMIADPEHAIAVGQYDVKGGQEALNFRKRQALQLLATPQVCHAFVEDFGPDQGLDADREDKHKLLLFGEAH